MALEIEAKVRVDALAPVRDALLAAGARRVGKVRETNTYLAVIDLDAALRVRREVDEDGRVRSRVTYKGPRRAGAYKTREEIEYDVSDAAAAIDAFARVGHAATLVFEKDRETFTLGDCEVVLDDLPRLGTFVEVEGPTEAAVRDVLARIGLGDAPTLDEGYAAMLARPSNGAEPADFPPRRP